MNDSVPCKTMLNALMVPESYPNHTVRDLHIIETHSAWVVLTGIYAYKIKKPVNFGFLDFSTLDKRRQYCEKEVELNQRYAPGIYLSVVAIRGSPDDLHVDVEHGPLLEYAVKMRQFSANCLLSDMATQKKLRWQHVDQMLSTITSYHQTAAKAEPQSLYGSPDQVKRWVYENFRHIAKDLHSDIEKQQLNVIHRWAKGQSQLLEETFTQRKREGKIRDCHGDLHLRNLTAMEGKIIAFDCIEFNDELRWIDVISEVAFLMVDLNEKGYLAFANAFINGYLQLTGDYHGLTVLRYYLVYRAMVRAKVAVIRRQQLPVGTVVYQHETEDYHRYMAYANQCIRFAAPKVIITFGLSGSGKSTVARGLSQRLGAIQICSDIERKRLAGIPSREIQQATINREIYSDDHTQVTYHYLIQLAARIIDAHFSVIIDATFLRKEYRTVASNMAKEKGVPFIILSCNADENILRQRIVRRSTDQQDASDATLSVLTTQQQQVQPLSKREGKQCVKINTKEKGFEDRILHHRLFRTDARCEFKVPCS